MASFKDKIQGAKRVLLVHPRGIGDAIHCLPTLEVLRRNLPDAEFDFLVGDQALGLAGFVRGLRHTFSVPSYPKPKSKWVLFLRRIRAAWQIRQGRYDAIINMCPNESTAALLLISGVRHKLALRYIYSPVRWRWLYSDVVDRRWGNQSSYRFTLENLSRAGFDCQGVRLGSELVDLTEVDLPSDLRPPFFHLSLFASSDSKQLSEVEARRLLGLMLERFPDHQLAISCSAASRELERINRIIQADNSGRIRIYPGSLNLPQLAAVLAAADAHVGPDTGTVHLALLAGGRTISWHLNEQGMLAWIPYGREHRVILSLLEQVRFEAGMMEGSGNVSLRRVTAEHVMAALEDLISDPSPSEANSKGPDVPTFHYVV